MYVFTHFDFEQDIEHTKNEQMQCDISKYFVMSCKWKKKINTGVAPVMLLCTGPYHTNPLLNTCLCCTPFAI